MDLTQLTNRQLLQLDAKIKDELKGRGVLRTNNAPLGDYTEHLVVTAFGWSIAPNSEKSFDALSSDGNRIQIKGRRIVEPNGSVQLSAIRNFSGFDTLCIVLFDKDYNVTRAVLVPSPVAEAQARRQSHTNSYLVFANTRLLEHQDAIDVTYKFTVDQK